MYIRISLVDSRNNIMYCEDYSFNNIEEFNIVILKFKCDVLNARFNKIYYARISSLNEDSVSIDFGSHRYFIVINGISLRKYYNEFGEVFHDIVYYPTKEFLCSVGNIRDLITARI